MKFNLFVILFVFIIYCLFNCFIECLPKFIRGKYFDNSNKKKIKLDQIPEQFYNQRLDHFSQSETTRWNQRYWLNDQYFDGNGPVFIMIGGEGEENPIWMTNGQWINFAQQFKALCVLLEHRFYGHSRPTEDLSDKSLAYLSSEQALADLATFRQFIHLKFNLTDSNKWISFGGSYPGSLSAWFRLKYPHLVHAAVSSSAPMFALIDFQDYMVVVNNSLSLYNSECPIQIQKATEKVKQMMTTIEGREALQSLFNTCDPIESDDDVINLYAALSGNFEGVVQYNKDNRAFEGAIDTNLTIDLLCNTMINKNIDDPLKKYAQVNKLVLQTYKQSCLDASYKSFIDQMKKTSWNDSAAVGGRQWTYQTCVEFGFFQSTTSDFQPFSKTVPVEFYIQQCKDIFGDNFDLNLLEDAVQNTNVNYGGYDYEGSRVVFINGEIDPWHALGFTKSPPNGNTQTVFIKGTAHCADMYPSGEDDPLSLISARLKIGTLLSKWLKEN